MDFYSDLIKKEVEEQPDKLRTFSKTPYKVLNAPKLKDDFYTTQLDWGKNGLISVVLDNAVYVWESTGNDAEKLVQGYVSSVKWGKGLVVGQ